MVAAVADPDQRVILDGIDWWQFEARPGRGSE